MKNVKVLFLSIAIGSLLFLGCKKKETKTPASFTIFDFSNTYSMIGDLSFEFRVAVGGSEPTRAHVTVNDAAGNPLKDVVTDEYSNDESFKVNVPLSPTSFVGPITIKVTDNSGGNLKSATHDLSIDTEINKPYTSLSKGVTVTGDVSAQDNNYGDFADVIKIPNAVVGDSVIVDFDHLSDPGKFADIYIYDANGVNVFTNISVPIRGKSKTKLTSAGTYYVYVVFNSNAGFQEHWYWLTWK